MYGVHRHLSTRIYINLELLKAERRREMSVQRFKPPKYVAQSARVSLVNANSFWRRSGFYGCLIQQQRSAAATSTTVISLGFCMYLWLAILSVTFELIMSDARSQSGWKIDWHIRVRNRVGMESPLMQACQIGDVIQIQQILNERRGRVNDQAIYSGKTALLVLLTLLQVDT